MTKCLPREVAAPGVIPGVICSGKEVSIVSVAGVQRGSVCPFTG